MTQNKQNCEPLPNCTKCGESVKLEGVIIASANGKRFEMNPLYSGNTIQMKGSEYPIVLAIDGAILPREVEALLEHDEGKITGKIEAIRVGANADGTPNICASGILADTDAAKEVIEEMKNGREWKSSIHAVGVAGHVDIVPRGTTLEENGRVFHGPLKHYKMWILTEGSFVTRGADAYAAAEVFASARKENMNEELRQYILKMNFNPDDLTPDEIAKFEECLKERNEAVAAATKAAEPVTAQGDDGKKPDTLPTAEPGKEPDPQATGNGEGNPEPEPVKATGNGFPPPPKADNLGYPGVPRHGNDRNRPYEFRKMEVGILNSMGMSGDDIKASGNYTDAEISDGLSNRYSHGSIQAFAGSVNRQAGYSSAPPRVNMRFGEDFFSALPRAPRAEDVLASANFSSLPAMDMLRDVANARMRFYFDRRKSVLRQLCEEVNASDLKTFYTYDYDIAGGLLKVDKDGLIESATVKPETYTVKVDTRARNLILTEEDIINDTWNGFSQLTKLFARKGAAGLERGIADSVKANLSTKFTTANGNRMAANTPLTYDNVAAAIAMFEKMESLGSTSDDTDYIDAEPKWLLVAPDQAQKAMDIVSGQFLTVNGANNTVQGKSPLRYPLTVISSPHWGSSDTNHWAIFADALDCPVKIIGFYNGIKAPVVRSTQSSPDILGQIFTVVFRWGIGDASSKCGVYADGDTANG